MLGERSCGRRLIFHKYACFISAQAFFSVVSLIGLLPPGISGLVLSCPTSLLSPQKGKKVGTMGLGASLAKADVSSFTANPKETSSKKDDEWKATVERFTSALLDTSYLHLPVRGSTVHASSQYPSSNPDYPGLMPGSHKHLGGAYDPTDGCIYGVPAHSAAILCIHPDGTADYKLSTIPLPKRIQDCRFKWLRGIISNGCLWAIPSFADSVLCVDIDAHWGRRKLPDGETDVVKLIPLPESHQLAAWQWHGAATNKEQTAIYCIPSNAEHVLKVDMVSRQTTLISIDVDSHAYPSFTLQVTNKWYGGIRGDDNAVYGVPYRACGVLRIDCNTDTAKVIGPDYGVGNYNWHGGIKVKGKIYAHPSHAETVLVIDTTETSKGECYELPIHRAAYDTDPRKNYKWLGGAVGADGNIYCPACDTSACLKINVKTDYCETLGFAGKAKNKWQGAILARDNCIYCIPANGVQICRIATDPAIQGDNPVQLFGSLPAHKDKWQGAAMGKDGSLYFVPENGYRVLKLTPPAEPPNIVDGVLPSDDVQIELM